MAFARPQNDKPVRLIVQTPVDVVIAPGVKVEPTLDKGAVILAFRACTMRGCFAESDLAADQLASFRGRDAPGQITITGADGKAFALQISLRGLDQALDAFMKRGS
jgi:invasion protein IalB